MHNVGIFADNQYMTARFVLLVWVAMLNGFNIRTTRVNLLAGLGQNMRFVYIAAMVLVGVFVLVQYDGMVFNTVPLDGHQWWAVLLLAAMVIPIGIFGKILFAKRQKQIY